MFLVHLVEYHLTDTEISVRSHNDNKKRLFSNLESLPFGLLVTQDSLIRFPRAGDRARTMQDGGRQTLNVITRLFINGNKFAA